MTEYFAIRHIPTGRLLPNPRGRGGRGGTFTEFDDEGVPRLFEKRTSAEQALRWWLGGKVVVGQTQDFEGYVDEDWRIVPQKHRKAEECDIVSVRMEVQS